MVSTKAELLWLETTKEQQQFGKNSAYWPQEVCGMIMDMMYSGYAQLSYPETAHSVKVGVA